MRQPYGIFGARLERLLVKNYGQHWGKRTNILWAEFIQLQFRVLSKPS